MSMFCKATATPGLPMKRDGEVVSSHARHDSRECEGTNIGHIFSGIVARASSGNVCTTGLTLWYLLIIFRDR
jgi:hypothetical protein